MPNTTPTQCKQSNDINGTNKQTEQNRTNKQNKHVEQTRTKLKSNNQLSRYYVMQALYNYQI